MFEQQSIVYQAVIRSTMHAFHFYETTDVFSVEYVSSKQIYLPPSHHNRMSHTGCSQEKVFGEQCEKICNCYDEKKDDEDDLIIDSDTDSLEASLAYRAKCSNYGDGSCTGQCYYGFTGTGCQKCKSFIAR